MRLYLKLGVAIALFVLASGLGSPQMIADLAFDARVAMVYRFGSADDVERLVDDTQRALAAQNGRMDAYLCGKRFQQLVAERTALAECEAHGELSEHELDRIRDECRQEAFGQLVLDKGRRD